MTERTAWGEDTTGTPPALDAFPQTSKLMWFILLMLHIAVIHFNPGQLLKKKYRS